MGIFSDLYDPLNSWVKNGKEKPIPICQASEICNVNIKDEEHNKKNILGCCDIWLHWDYFDRNFECYCLQTKYDSTKENYV